MNLDDFQKQLKEIYHPPQNKFTLIDIPELRYMAIDGRGDPEKNDIAGVMKWLYGVVFVMTPFAKEVLGKMFAYPPPEFLLWAEDPHDFIQGNKDKWSWRVMILLADFMTDDFILTSAAKAEEKKGPPASPLQILKMHEGKCVQIKHVGDYGGVARVCEKLYGEFLPRNNLTPDGHYHEIYLDDPNRIDPKKRKVVIRQPVKSCD